MPLTRVPATLHAELSEYANLVRVLRTNRTLDLTTQLLRHAEQQRSNAAGADTWTSWPLIDCFVPEWTFADEIEHLADIVWQQQQQQQQQRPHAQVARASGGDHAASESSSESESDGEGSVPAAAVTKPLVLGAGALLVRILNLMADQRPSAPGSMQNRLWPLNWQDVICVLAASGVLDPAILAHAERRLERIYGPSSTKAVERLALVAPPKARFAALASVAEDQLFAPPVLHPRPGRRDKQVRRSKKSQPKSRAMINVDTDTDADA